MAQRVIRTLVDDLDGTSEATQTVHFALDGVEYEIDLSDDNAESLRDALGAYIEASRRTGGRRTMGTRNPAKPKTGPKISDVREWAAANGHQVADRGRIPAAVLKEYQAAHA